MAKEKAVFVIWEPRKAVLGMEQLSPLAELAYRRIIDFIYITGNRLHDEDSKLSRVTKTYRAWKKIKKELLKYDKIYIENGFIKDTFCDSKLASIKHKIENKKRAGEASAKARSEKSKPLEDNETGSTPVATEHPTESQQTPQQKGNLTTKPLNHLTIEPLLEEKSANALSSECVQTGLMEIPESLDRRTPAQALKIWNETAERWGLPIAKKMTKTRQSKLKARLNDCGGLEGWQAACEKVEASPFLRGEKGEWRADLDFMLQESKFTKLMEGAYDDSIAGDPAQRFEDQINQTITEMDRKQPNGAPQIDSPGYQNPGDRSLEQPVSPASCQDHEKRTGKPGLSRISGKLPGEAS